MSTVVEFPGAALPRRDAYILKMAAVMTAFILFAFAQWSLRGFTSPSSAPVWVHVHGMSMLCWLALLVGQSLMIRSGNRAAHAAMGAVGLALILFIVATGLFAGYQAVVLHRVPPIFEVPGFLALTWTETLSFGLTVCAALALRKRSDWHKRLMLGATVVAMEPAFGRLVPVPLLGSWSEWVILCLQLGVIAYGAWQDRKASGIVHPAWATSAAIVVATHIAFEALAVFPPFVAFANNLAGV
jgi:hypothetical protein